MSNRKQYLSYITIIATILFGCATPFAILPKTPFNYILESQNTVYYNYRISSYGNFLFEDASFKRDRWVIKLTENNLYIFSPDTLIEFRHLKKIANYPPKMKSMMIGRDGNIYKFSLFKLKLLLIEKKWKNGFIKLTAYENLKQI